MAVRVRPLPVALEAGGGVGGGGFEKVRSGIELGCGKGV